MKIHESVVEYVAQPPMYVLENRAGFERCYCIFIPTNTNKGFWIKPGAAVLDYLPLFRKTRSKFDHR